MMISAAPQALTPVVVASTTSTISNRVQNVRQFPADRRLSRLGQWSLCGTGNGLYFRNRGHLSLRAERSPGSERTSKQTDKSPTSLRRIRFRAAGDRGEGLIHG